MSNMPNSPYTAFSSLLTAQSVNLSPAELQGLLFGRACAQADADPGLWLEEVSQWLGCGVPDALQQPLQGLQVMAKDELSTGAVAVTLLLPGDEHPLFGRLQALGAWCQRFLDGFGGVTDGQALSKESQEMLEDIAAIAQIDPGDEETTMAADAAEKDYMELVEYLRVVPVLLHAERVTQSKVPAPTSGQ